MEEVRINKYLSEAGVCSRRQADQMIEEGRIVIDGRIAKMGDKVRKDSVVLADGKEIIHAEPPVLLAVNKPRGIVCTTAEIEKDNIVKFLQYPIRIYPIGRLDKDSEGLILMTNQGEIVNKILRGSNYHEKEYYVRVDRPLTEAFLTAMRQGVPILDTITRPCIVEQAGRCEFRIILTQGLNRQIRRMCEFLGMRVLYLKRVRIMNIQLAGLPVGEYREIQGEEYTKLMNLLENSSSLSYQERQKRKKFQNTSHKQQIGGKKKNVQVHFSTGYQNEKQKSVMKVKRNRT